MSAFEHERVEALIAREQDLGYEPLDQYDPADDRRRTGPPEPDPYAGPCGGCGAYVSPRLPGGSCMWRPPGPWHPSCRRSDKAAGGTATQPPR